MNDAGVDCTVVEILLFALRQSFRLRLHSAGCVSSHIAHAALDSTTGARRRPRPPHSCLCSPSALGLPLRLRVTTAALWEHPAPSAVTPLSPSLFCRWLRDEQQRRDPSPPGLPLAHLGRRARCIPAVGH